MSYIDSNITIHINPKLGFYVQFVPKFYQSKIIKLTYYDKDTL